MNLVDPLPALLCGVVLFLLPGTLFLSLLRHQDRAALDLAERLFLLVAASIAASAWVGLVLAEAGSFSLQRAATIIGVGCAGVAVALRKRLSFPFAGASPGVPLATALAVLALAFGLQARPSEYLFGGRDPGTYIAAMGQIGRTGAIAYVDPVVQSVPAEDRELFFREPNQADFSWARFMGFPLERPDTARVFPEFFHLFPAFGAYLFQAMGAKGALATPALFGILGTLAFFFALRRIFDAATAALATVLVSLSVIQVWFARYPVSETLSQFLIFLALLGVAHWEERSSLAFGVLAGVALGLSLLVRIDSVLLVAPLAVYLVTRRAHHDLTPRQAAALLAPLAALSAHAAVHAALFSRKYVLNIATRPYWNQPAAVWIAAVALAAALLWLTFRFGPLLVERLEAHGPALRRSASLAVLLLAAYAYFLRPRLSAWAGADGNPTPLPVTMPGDAALWFLGGFGFHRLAAHDAQSFYRLGWFLSPLVLALAVGGLVLLFHRFRRRHLMFTLMAVGFALFYFYKMRIWNDYYFALRRFVPLVAPAFCALSAFALVTWFRSSRRARLPAAALAIASLALVAKEMLPIAPFVDWRRSVRFVADVARRFSPEDVVVFEQRASIHLLSLPLWAIHGVNVLELARFNPDPERLDHLIGAWRKTYRNIYFVKTYRTSLCGVFLQDFDFYSFATAEWERAEGRRPSGPVPRALRFTIQRVVSPDELQVPALDSIDIGGSDDFQVSGFFDKELAEGNRSYRWTGACASVYVPGVRAGGAVILTATADKRPPSHQATAVVSLSGQRLGEFPVEGDWNDYAFPVPAVLPNGPPLLRLDIHDPRGRAGTFRPQNVLAGSPDDRDLGVAVDRIRFTATPASGATIAAQALGRAEPRGSGKTRQ